MCIFPLWLRRERGVYRVSDIGGQSGMSMDPEQTSSPTPPPLHTHSDQLKILAPPHHQLRVVAALNNSPLICHIIPIRLPDRTHTVCDRNRTASLRSLFQHILNQGFRLHVNRRGHLVEDEDGGIPDERRRGVVFGRRLAGRRGFRPWC